jgi:hypothetical protein
VAPHRGGTSADQRGKPAALWGQGRAVCVTAGATGTCGARVLRTPASSRALATTTWLACLPRALTRRTRLHRRPCTRHLRAWRGGGRGSRRSGTWRLPWAGEREAQAPATHARRACVLPAFVRDPCRRRSPLESAEGLTPKHGLRGRGCSTRLRSPSAATVVTVTVHGTPRSACRASTTGCTRHEVTWSCRACSRRPTRAVWSVTAGTSSGTTMGCAGGGTAHLGEPPTVLR